MEQHPDTIALEMITDAEAEPFLALSDVESHRRSAEYKGTKKQLEEPLFGGRWSLNGGGKHDCLSGFTVSGSRGRFCASVIAFVWQAACSCDRPSYDRFMKFEFIRYRIFHIIAFTAFEYMQCSCAFIIYCFCFQYSNVCQHAIETTGNN